MRAKYVQRHDNEGWTIKNRTMFLIACCDCKLIHKLVINAPKQRKGSLLGIAAARDNRRTANARRKKK
jgi:hypothetical protein